MSLTGQEILIVDDDEEFRILIKRILESAGINVIECGSIFEAEVMLKTRAPHLILLDLNLTDESGFTFLKSVSENPKFKETPVVMVTASQSASDVSTALAFGAEDFMVKPIKQSNLIQKIRKILRKKEILRKTFEVNQMPNVSAIIDAELISISETQCSIHSSVKFTPNKEIGVKSQLLMNLEINDCHFETGPVSVSTESRLFNSHILLKGANETNILSIRKFQRNTKKI